MRKRLQAAAGTYFDNAGDCTYETAFRLALEAADKVMFSDSEIKRTAADSWNMLGGRPWAELTEPLQRQWTSNVRVVLAALRGEQP